MRRFLDESGSWMRYLTITETPAVADPMLAADALYKRAYRNLWDVARGFTSRMTAAPELRDARRQLDMGDRHGAANRLRCLAMSMLGYLVELRGLNEIVDLRERALHARRNLDRYATANGLPIGNLVELDALENPLRETGADMALKPELLESLKHLHATLADAQQEVQRAALRRAMNGLARVMETLERTQPCPAGAQSDPALVKPRLDMARSRSTDAYYPPAARLEYVEGVATIRAEVSAKGCPERADLLARSGDERLDAAALRWAIDGAMFIPVEHEGRATPGAAIFDVRFKLYDNQGSRHGLACPRKAATEFR